MKIGIGSDGNSLESPIAKRFGHAKYYLIYDSENKSIEAVKNENHHPSGENHNHNNLYSLTDKGVAVFIVGNIGPHAFAALKERNAEIYLARKMTVAEAIDKFKTGELQKLNEPTAKKSIGHH